MIIRYAWNVTVQPAVEPVSLEDAKLHLGLSVDETQWDGYIPGLITGARKHTENRTGRAMIEQTATLSLDQFPSVIYIPRAPLISVESINYIDSSGVEQPLDPDEYQADLCSCPGRIQPAYGCYWPTARTQMNAVTVTVKVGYGDAAADVPADLIDAIKLLVAHRFENREAVGETNSKLAEAYDAIVINNKVRMEPMEV